jgi:hypothetical protein
MRVRKMDSNDDMQFGHGSADFWFNQVDGVGQTIKTRLLLFRGEWFLDVTEGTPWGGIPLSDAVVRQGQILGAQTQLTRDLAIKSRVLATQGVISISDYSSSVDPNTRSFLVNMVVDTIFGNLAVSLNAGSNTFSIGYSALGGTQGLG